MNSLPSPLPLLSAVRDPRKPSHTQIAWVDMWVVVLVALLTAPKNILALSQWVHDQHALFHNHFQIARLPSQATLYRFFWAVECSEVEAVLQAWVQRILGPDHTFEVASVDGKYLAGTARPRAALKAVLTCGAYLHHHGIPVACSFAPDGNEVAAAKRQLSALKHLGVELLVADAGYTGHQFACAVRDASLDYLLPLKNNQSAALGWARLACSYPPEQLAHDEIRRGGETWSWTLELTRAVPEDVSQGFQDAQALLKLTRHVQRDRAAHTCEVCYAVTSSRRSATDVLQAWRGHWGIENRVHHVRDTVFAEDHCRTRRAGPVLAVLRSFILILAQFSTDSVLRFTRRATAQPLQTCRTLGWGPLS